MNNFEKRQGYSKQKPDADRDGKNFEKRDFKSALKRPRTTDSSYKSEPRNFKPDYSEKPAFTKKPFGERKSYNSSSENNNDRPRFNRYNSSSEQNGDRPHFNRSNSFSERNGEKPRFNRYNSEQNRENTTGGNFRPRGDRPNFNRYNDRNENRPNNRYNDRNENNTGNRYNRDDNRPKNGFTLRKNSDNYDPNAKYSHKKQTEYRKVNVDPNKPVRLNKFLANAGICSRREADEYITAGVITVNGKVVDELGAKVLPADHVMFHNQPVRSERKIYILLNKPKDCITTAEDTHDRTTVLDIVKNACSERIYPVGRLDRNTTGVILLTNDGDLSLRLTHPKYDKKKIYHVVLDRPIETADFEKVLAGVQLDDDFFIAADALEYIKEDDNKQLGIEIHSGQNRVVRRIFEKLGYKIVRLDRVYFAGLTKKNLPRGKYRFLNEREINMLKMNAYE
jgi:pseudouridine synthase